MSYEDKVVEECLESLKKEMRCTTLTVKKTKKRYNEYRINNNKVGNFRFHLFKLFHLAFKEGVYVGKSEK